jgi:lipopolysaccharide biosynthesis protein
MTMPKVIVIVHVYYMDMLDDLKGHLDKLRESLDFTTIATVTRQEDIDEVVQKLDAVTVNTGNKGRDVLPFLEVLRWGCMDDFDYALKIHTKTTSGWHGPSPEPDILWRDIMWRDLISPAGLDDLKKGDSGMFAPSNLWKWEYGPGDFRKNWENMGTIADILGVERVEEPFIAGTMFWFRVDSLSWVGDYFKDLEPLFEEEEGADDGKMEHAFERMFYRIANTRKKR